MTAMLALLFTLFLTPNAALARDETSVVREVATITVKYERGTVSILRVQRQTLPNPERLRRWRGRFEARALGGGGKTLDFVRFDFPLMAAAEAPEDVTPDAAKVAQKLRDHVTATAIVRAPLAAGTSSVAIYDSFTKKSVTADLASLPASLPASSPASPPAAPPAASSPAPAAAGAGSTKR
jgi:hypothetical protein